MYKVIILGSGHIGARHLQGLACSKHPVRITVVNRGEPALKRAASYYREVMPSRTTAEFLLTVPRGENYDLAIVACSSEGRLSALETFLARSSTRNMILEKFLFSNENEYDIAGELFEKYDVRAWVNCPRRMIPEYESIRDMIAGPIEVSVTGGMWGLCCNSIHIVDLAAWLTGNSRFSFDPAMLDADVISSKRAGYIEFSGTLHGRGGDGSRLTLTAHNGFSPPMLIQIASTDLRVLSDEYNQTLMVGRESSNWKMDARPLPPILQSKLSNILLEELVEGKGCRLTPYAESRTLHLSLLAAFRKHYAGIRGSDSGFAVT